MSIRIGPVFEMVDGKMVCTIDVPDEGPLVFQREGIPDVALRLASAAGNPGDVYRARAQLGLEFDRAEAGVRVDAAVAELRREAQLHRDWVQPKKKKKAAPACRPAAPDVKRVFEITDDLATLSANDFGKAKANLRSIFGNKLSIRDLDRAVKAARTPRANEQHDAGAEPACPYEANEHGIFHVRATPDGQQVRQQLTNFRATVVGDVFKDDGAETDRYFEVEAVLSGQASRATVRAADYQIMNWIAAELGPGAVLHAGASVRDHARTAIQMLSEKPIPKRQIYTHLGWRKIGEEMVYLHAGGAIGAQGVRSDVIVQAPPALANFILPPPPEGEQLKTAIRASLEFLTLAPLKITAVLYCALWRSVLGTTDASVHIAGETGSMKSELAALVQQHFGRGMIRERLPASWSATDNALEMIAFSAKDALLVIDDFCPGGSQHDIQRYNLKADRVFRAQGNSQGRQRLKSDASLRDGKPPRGLILSTGEEIPSGHSVRARLMVVELKQGDIRSDELSLRQEAAASDLYAKAMAGYLKCQVARIASLQTGIPAEIERIRSAASDELLHKRTPTQVANLTLGLKHFLAFAVEAGAISKAEQTRIWNECWTAIMAESHHQSSIQNQSNPVQQFMELLISAVGSGHAHFADPDGRAPESPEAWGWRPGHRADLEPQGSRVGWVEGDDLYLEPHASYDAAQRMGGGSTVIPIAATTLHKRMDERGLLIHGEKGLLRDRRTLQGQVRRVIHIRTHAYLCIGDGKCGKSVNSDNQSMNHHQEREGDYTP